ncbi:hypothetical protein Tco_0290556 [Tanacetum coccineum]
MGDEKIELNSLEDIYDLVPIPRVFKKPLNSLDLILETFDMTIINPLFDFDFEFILNSDNPMFDIQNEESDEFETETIMEEVQIHSSQSTVQIPPPYGKMADFVSPFTRLRCAASISHHGLCQGEHILIDREAKKESMDRELAARLAVCEIQRGNEDLKILSFDTTGMALEDAAKIEAFKEKTRATYFNF